MKGFNEQGILELKSELPEWEEKNKDTFYPWGFPIFFAIIPDIAERMSRYYKRLCWRLYIKILKVRSFDEIIREKENMVAEGDVKAMFSLVKAYEGGRFCLPDKEKSRYYYDRAKETWVNVLSLRYKEWLDRAVRDSGLEMIGQIGREYIAGNFAERAKNDNTNKLKKELQWLTEKIKSGDGWAAFTKGNIFHYGYGRWPKREKGAYKNYQIAAQSKDSVYSLEYGDMCLKNGDLSSDLDDAYSRAFYSAYESTFS